MDLEQPAIVHLYNRPLAWLFRWFRKDLAYYLEIQNSHLVSKNGFVQRLLNRWANHFDHIVFCSDYLAKEYAPNNLKSPPFSTVYNGLSLILRHLGEHPEFQAKKFALSSWKTKLLRLDSFPTDTTLRLLFTGRIVEDKGLHILFDALEKSQSAIAPLLEKHHHKLEIRIVGAPLFGKESTSAYAREIEERLKLSSLHVVFTGYLNKLELSREYLRSDILVVPSIWEEPFGIVNVEGMYFQSVVLASRCGGIPEIIRSEKNGYLFEKGNVDALSNLLVRVIGGILSHDSYLRLVTDEAKIVVQERFLVEHHFEKTLSLYEDIANSKVFK